LLWPASWIVLGLAVACLPMFALKFSAAGRRWVDQRPAGGRRFFFFFITMDYEQ
jgi:hypothetical protein